MGTTGRKNRKRKNRIRLGSALVVRDGAQAGFRYPVINNAKDEKLIHESH